MGSLARYWTIVDLYDGSADAMLYYGQGQNIARYFAAGDFSIIDTYTFRGAGTTWMVHVTALVYTLLPVSAVGSFFLFAGFAFAGSVLHYHAFRMALPDQRSRLYAFLLFFSPSILFWPSSLGKDAWIFLWTGVVMWGWAIYIQRGRLSGLIAIAISLFLINLIRPHIAAFLALSLAGVFLFIGTGRPRSLATWLVSGALLVALAGMMLVSGADYLRLDSLSVEAVSEFYEDQQVTSFGGGSAFQPPNVFNPIGAVYGIITTLFRPFPWEAHNAQSLVTALEGVFWIGLVWLRRKVLWARIRAVHRSPVLAFALVYSLIMALAMTVSGNFAIIARQRLMFLPLFWMLLG
jgi:hypothetical protein